MDRQKFDNIFQQLSFGTKTTKNVQKLEKNKLPLRVLPKDESVPKKRQKLAVEDDDEFEGIFQLLKFIIPTFKEGIRLFADSNSNINLYEKPKIDKKIDQKEEKVIF